MIILAIDPGPTVSTALLWSEAEQRVTEIYPDIENGALLRFIRVCPAAQCVIERVRSYGMSVGAETFETCEWIGRMAQTWEDSHCPKVVLMDRLKVKMHLCHNSRAKDGNIRQALIDRFGPPGTKKNKGKLYGVSKHGWSALALAVCLADGLEAPA